MHGAKRGLSLVDADDAVPGVPFSDIGTRNTPGNRRDLTNGLRGVPLILLAKQPTKTRSGGSFPRAGEIPTTPVVFSHFSITCANTVQIKSRVVVTFCF